MKLEKIKDEKTGLKFYHRPNTSDFKSMKEVILKNDYERSWFKIHRGEKWLDLGGYVGHFGVLAASKGAYVRAFEPFPESYKVYQQNIKLNQKKYPIQIHLYNKAVIGGSKDKSLFLGINKNGNYWRNSVIKTPAKGSEIMVECVTFRGAMEGMNCLKMDIEGAEFAILKELKLLKKLKKMVYEHSFDINPSLDDYRATIKSLQGIFKRVSFKAVPPKEKLWKPSWFPHCAKIFCSNEDGV